LKRDFMKLAAIISILILFTPIGFGSMQCATPELGFPGSAFIPTASEGEQELRVQVFEEEAVGNWSVDQNFHSSTDWGGLWVGVDSEANLARSLVKFDLSHISQNAAIESAHLCAYMSGALGLEDVPIGVYFTSDDAWTETTVTWANQPSHNPEPASVIDSPPSPDMFVAGNWYCWDITQDVLATLEGDKVVSLVLRLTDEFCPAPRGAVFTEDEYCHFNASYISLRTYRPMVQGLEVNGEFEGPSLEYLQDPHPLLSWEMNDSDYEDYQSDFEILVSDDPASAEEPLWSVGHTDPLAVITDCTSSTTYPFSVANEVRIQYKYMSPPWNRSGVVDRVRLEVSTDQSQVLLENLVVSLCSTSLPGELGASFLANYGTARPLEILRSDLYLARISDGFLELDVENLFILSQDMNLIVELRYTNSSAGNILSSYTPGTGLGSVAYTWGPDAYVEEDAFFRYSYAFGMSLDLSSVAPLDLNSTNPTTSIPFGLPSNSTGTLQIKLNNTLFTTPGLIRGLFFHVNSTSQDVTLGNLSVMLAESYLEGELDQHDLESNYYTQTSQVVLDSPVYTLWNHGGYLALDFETAFHFSGQAHLLVQVSWDGQSGGPGALTTTAAGGFCAWNFTGIGEESGNASWSPQMFVDFIYQDTSVEYSGPPLPEEQYVYWHVRVCDSAGLWSEWDVLSFRYHPFNSGPQFSGLLVSPDPSSLGQEVLIEIQVTFVLGVSQVLFEIGNSNHSMTQGPSERYSFTWVPQQPGNEPFTIYMESVVGTWNTTSGWVHVEDSSSTTTAPSPNEFLQFLIAGVLVGVGAVSAAFILRRRRASSV
jgi:hypothetical protein